MLEAIQPHGTRPPLFVIHGMYGIMNIGESLAEVLGPDQPIYGINARGFDGREEPCRTVKEMAAVYVRVIREACTSGPYFVGGMCHGGLAAIEVARELLLLNQHVAPVLCMDPGPAPHRSPAGLKKLEQALTQPSVQGQLYDQAMKAVRNHAARAATWPFDINDPVQAQTAVEVAMAASLAFARHHVAPFYGPTELILSSAWAGYFFTRDHEWQSALPGKRTVHVLQGVHTDLFDVHRAKVCRLIRIYIENALAGESAPLAGDAIPIEAEIENFLTAAG
jgi:thioesterase domain-containing protein